MSFRQCAIIPRNWTWFMIIGLMASIRATPALENGVGRVPAMGWNPWNTFLHNTSLPLMKEMIDSLDSKGMREAGYNYVCADGGGLMSSSDADIQAFINYGHSKGFKVGLYVNKTNGNEATLVAKWTQMGFDYLKHDYFQVSWADSAYSRMRTALLNSGRPVYYVIHPMDFHPEPDIVSNAHRVANDISWKANNIPWGTTKDNGEGVIGEVMNSRKYQQFAHPGYFNDMDMMGVGIQTLTTEEAKTHFSLWSIMASILIEGSDIRKIAKDRLDILLNREVIAVNQDSLGEQGRVVWSRYTATDSTEVISKKMKDGSRAVLLFNRSGPTKSITVKLSDIGLTGMVHVRDLWKHTNLPDTKDSMTIAGIPQHGCAVLRMSSHAISTANFKHAKVIRIPISTIQTGLKIFNLKGTRLLEGP